MKPPSIKPPRPAPPARPAPPPRLAPPPAPTAPGAAGSRIPVVRRIKKTGNHEADKAAVLTEAQKAFRESREKEQRAMLEAGDFEFWFSVVAVSRSQKEWMLRQLGLLQHGDKYIYGEDFWSALRRLIPSLPPLPDAQAAIQNREGRDKGLVELAVTFDEIGRTKG